MARRENQREHRQTAPRLRVRGDRDVLLARMRRGGEPDRPAGERAGDEPPLGLVMPERRRALLQRSCDLEPGRRDAEPCEMLAGEVVLRQHAVKATQQAARHAAHPAPAAKAAIGHAGIDQHHGCAAVMGRAQRRRPEIAFGPDRKVRAPVVEEPLDPGQHVERRELVDAAFGQPHAHHLCRGDGAGGDEAGQVGPLGVEPAQHLEQRRGLADAGGMEPGEPPRGPRQAGLAPALAEALGIFLALGGAARQQPPRHAARPARDRQVEREQRRTGAGGGHRRGTVQPSSSVGPASTSSSRSRWMCAMK